MPYKLDLAGFRKNKIINMQRKDTSLLLRDYRIIIAGNSFNETNPIEIHHHISNVDDNRHDIKALTSASYERTS